jgi:glycolate oxidase FAD binding subunit
VIEHPWQDLTCTVQAGCAWLKLQQVLSMHGQFVGLDPLFPERATVGVTGSLGTLAVITEVNFRLHSFPHHLRRFSVSAPQASRFSSLLAAIRASHLLVQALQIVRRSEISRMSIVLDAHPAAHQEELLSRMAADEGLSLEEMPASSSMERYALFQADATVLKIATMPAQVCETADLLQQVSPTVEVESVSQAHGLHTVAMRGPSASVMEAILRIRSGMLHPESTISVMQMAPGVDVKTFEIPVPALNVMQAIKQQFDPENILGPGKFF